MLLRLPSTTSTLAAQSFDERRVIGAYEAFRERRRVRATIHARTEHLRRLRVPEHAAVGGSHNATIFDHFERVDRRRGDNRAIGVERAFERVDGMRDKLWGNERAGAIVQHHVLIFLRRVFQT